MAEASIVREGVDRFRDALGSLEDEFVRVQRQVRSGRKKLERRLESQRKEFEKRTRKLRADLEKSAPVRRIEARRKEFERRTRKLRADLEKSAPGRRIEAWRKEANKQIEQGVTNVLSALQIASKHDMQRIDRKISQLNKRLKEMERAKRGPAKSPTSPAAESAA